MGDADSLKEPGKPPIEDGKEQNQEPVTENSVTDDSPQTPTNKAGIYLAVFGLIVITVAVILSRFPIPADWVGMATSEEKSQVAIEEVNGRSTKTTTTIKTEPAKTLWDWMSLLLAPATLAALGFVFQSSQEQAKAAREEVEKKAEAAAKQRANEQAQSEKDRSDKQAQAEKDRSEDRLRADALESYINSISDLLIGKRLSVLVKQKERGTLTNREQDLLDAGMDIIRASTLSIFRRFTDYNDLKRTDGERKGSLLLFLYEAGLITNQKENVQGQEDTEPKQFQALLSLRGAILNESYLVLADLRGAILNEVCLVRANLNYADLRGVTLSKAYLHCADLLYANLSHANLRDAELIGANFSSAKLLCADLRGADFSAVNLSHADLSGASLSQAALDCADLYQANLSDANLSGADLSKANLSETNLSGANLSEANLNGAILLGVDLSQTKSLTPQQLELKEPSLFFYEPPLLCKVKLPENIKVDPDRDCKKIPELLRKRYPKYFDNLAEAQAYVNKQSMP